MSKTKIPGSRIRPQSIGEEHLKPDLQIPESKLNLVNSTHPHTNKDAIDVVRYTGTAETVDLKQLELVLAEIIAARRNGLNLGNTIDLKTDKTLFDELVEEISQARGESVDLKSAIQIYGDLINERLNNHFGSTAHNELDVMYSDFIAAKNGRGSLLEYLEEIAGAGVPAPDGDVVINVLKPWVYSFTVTDPTERVITFPHTYTMAANAIEVFEGPLRMYVGTDDDYLETTTSSITFNYDLPVGTVIKIRGTEKQSLFAWQQTFLSTNGQRIFPLLSDYEVGQNQLMVFEDGLLMTPGIDYLESSPTLITFTTDLPSSTRIVVCKRR